MTGWLVVVLLLAGLELWVRYLGLRDSIAAPSEAFSALARDLASGALSGEIGTTLARLAVGLGLAIVLGVVLGVLIGSSETLLAASTGVIEFMRPIPAIVLIPVAMVALGLGTPMIRFVVVYAAVWPILINTLYGVRGIDPMLHDVAATCGTTGVRKLTRVTLPAALPSIATGIRVGAPIALLVCVTAEFLTTGGGLGSYMQERQTALELPELYAAVLLTALLGYAINLLLRAVERRSVFWIGEARA